MHEVHGSFAEIQSGASELSQFPKRLPNAAAETALSVLAFNLTRVMNIVSIKPL